MFAAMIALYHFLGSVRFTLVLIALVALIVIAATVVEARSGSHLYAELFAYRSSYFLLLLGGFFVNILFAALRRWPFRRRHIPFLLTHLGLLAILSGVMVKNVWGLQGVMVIAEGSGSSELLLPRSEVIRVEKMEGEKLIVAQYPLAGGGERLFPELSMQLAGYAAHCRQRLASWVKGDTLCLPGIAPLPLQQWEEGKPLPSVEIALRPGELWELYACRAADPEAAAKELYLEGLHVDAAPTAVELEGLSQLNLFFGAECVPIPLEGAQALIGRGRRIALSRRPALLFVEDQKKELHLYLLDAYGRVFQSRFDGNAFPELYAYDHGFGGYTTQAAFPLPDGGIEAIENERYEALAALLERALSDGSRLLAHPLQELYTSCSETGHSFSDCFIAFLKMWEREGGWLFPNKPLEGYSGAFEAIDWEGGRGYSWLSWLLDESASYPSLQAFLEESRWPLLSRLDKEQLLPSLTQQLAAVGQQLPPPQAEPRAERLFSAALRTAGLGCEELLPPVVALSSQPLTLQSKLTLEVEPQQPLVKLEENRPMASLLFKTAAAGELLSLGYDATASGLKWPLLGGQYRVRFQPQTVELPFRLRLREARQVNYLHSNQPCSYECFLTIDGKEEVAMAMNQVHETWEGYRFYLGNISGGEGSLKKVQFIVNYDPAKYWLTYPGGFLVALGVLLLARRMGWNRLKAP